MTHLFYKLLTAAYSWHFMSVEHWMSLAFPSVSSLNGCTETSQPFPHSSSSSSSGGGTVCTTFISLVLWEICHTYETIHYTFTAIEPLCVRAVLFILCSFKYISLLERVAGASCQNIILSFQGDIVIWCKVPITCGGLRCHPAILELCCKVQQSLGVGRKWKGFVECKVEILAHLSHETEYNIWSLLYSKCLDYPNFFSHSFSLALSKCIFTLAFAMNNLIKNY